MSSIRTQLYLTDEQRQRINALAGAEGVTMAEVVRRAVDSYLEEKSPNPDPNLAATFGAAPDATTPSRDEWNHV